MVQYNFNYFLLVGQLFNCIYFLYATGHKAWTLPNSIQASVWSEGGKPWLVTEGCSFVGVLFSINKLMFDLGNCTLMFLKLSHLKVLWVLLLVKHTAWKVSKYGVISCPYFTVFGLNTGKYGPEITPYLDTQWHWKLLCLHFTCFIFTCLKWKRSFRAMYTLTLILRNFLLPNKIMQQCPV